MTVAIHISELSYTYANRAEPALRSVTLTFRAGEVTLIAGQSGSGKTTLARCINGLIPHSYKNGTLVGDIRCSDESTVGLSLAQMARRVGTVMQDPDKQVVATRVFNEIAFGLENLGLPRDDIRARVREAAAHLHITHLLDRETHALSGGELQKVVIAAALAMRPRILLLDEPLSSLDPPSARDALRLFRRMADEGMAVVMIEHRVRDALNITPEHCITLHGGTVAFDGDAASFRAWLSARHRMKNDGAPSVLRPASSVNSAPLLSFCDVHFAYPGASREQVSGVSFDVREGDVIALIGPNGAGKSTLCKLAIGLLRPSSGRVIVAGEDAERFTVAQIVRRVGYVFQNPAAMLFANTLREELSFGPRNVGVPADRIGEAIAHALRIVGLSHLSFEQSPFGLSFGQQKRVAVAGVLAMQPRVLILDEPTAGLDDGTAEDLLRRLLSAEHGPRAIVMVTHDLALARRFANRVILMAGGRIVANGALEETLEREDLMRQAQLVWDDLPEAD